jgi:hypothetical protein
MKAQKDIRNGTPQIVVLPNGFVAVGIFKKTGDLVTMDRSSIIRKWGTTRGLGEIALNGPTEKTVLDYIGVLCTSYKAVIFTITCNIFEWRKFLA